MSWKHFLLGSNPFLFLLLLTLFRMFVWVLPLLRSSALPTALPFGSHLQTTLLRTTPQVTVKLVSRVTTPAMRTLRVPLHFPPVLAAV